MAVELPQAIRADRRRNQRDSHRSTRIAGRGKEGELHMDIHGSIMRIATSIHLVVSTAHFVLAMVACMIIRRVR